MADNTTLNTGTGGDVIASDDIANVKYQRVKLIHGADGVNSGDVSTANPYPTSIISALPTGTNTIGNVGIIAGVASIGTVGLNAGANTIGSVNIVGTVPVSGPLTDTQLRATAVPVSAASLPLPAGAAADATLTGGTAKAIVRSATKGTAVAADLTSDPTDVNTQALHVNLKGVHSTVPVSGTFFQATQPVSAASLPLPTGAATEATLTGGAQKAIVRSATKGTSTAADVTSDATDVNTQALHVNLKGIHSTVPVTGAFFQTTQPVSAASLPLPTGAATEATLAARIPVNGQALMAASVPVVIASNQSVITITGALTDTQLRATAVPVSAASLPLPAGAAADATLTGGTAKAIVRSATKGTAVAADVTSNPVDVNTQALHVNLAGVNAVNATLGVETTKVIGTVNISAAQTIAAVTAITNALPVGANSIGTVVLTAETTKVIGTVNIAAGQAVTANAGTNLNTSALTLETTQTAMSGKLPATLGQKAMAASMAVVLPSDQTVPIDMLSLVSTANSSAVALGIGAVFTGTSEDVSNYAQIQINVFADQSSAVDGLSVQQSSNGTNWDHLDVFTIPLNTGKTFSFGVVARFYRIVYTNGAVANTVFRLQTVHHKTALKGSSQRPQDARSNDNDMDESLAYLQGYNGTSWDRLRSTVANGLSVDITRNAALVAGAASIGTVQQAALTKGTQGATGITTQDLKDAGRARVAITFFAVAPAVADTLLTLVKVTAGVAAAGAVSIGVTAGKILRITSITFSIKSAAAAAAFATLTLRQNPVGATAIGSVAELRLDVGNTGATIGAADKIEAILPEGIEFSGTQTLGVSLAAQAITNIMSISLNGFEY